MTWTSRERAEGIPVPWNNPTQTEQGLGAGTEDQEGEAFPDSWFPFLKQYQHRDFPPPRLRTTGGFFGKTVSHTSQKHSLSGSWVWTENPELKRWQRERKEPWHSPKSQGARARQSEAGKEPLSPRAVFNSLSGCLGSLFLPTWN